MNHRNSVRGDMNVQLDRRGTEVDSPEEARQGVLHAVPRRTPVTDAKSVAHAEPA